MALRNQTKITTGIYSGEVVHKRLRPVTHALKYRVFALLLDCNQLYDVARRPRLLSYNRFNLLSVHDKDHGNGTPIAANLASIADDAGIGETIRRFMMLCYPRILGYGFNPITVYYGLDADERVKLMIYEVNNTFGQRKTYVIPTGGQSIPGDVISQSCQKQLYVSPFNTDHGCYRFALTTPAENLTIGVALYSELGATMKAHFRGTRCEMTSANLLSALARTGWMTVKVTAAIHFEALRLWLKGLRLVPRPPPPEQPVTIVDGPSQSQSDAKV